MNNKISHPQKEDPLEIPQTTTTLVACVLASSTIQTHHEWADFNLKTYEVQKQNKKEKK